MVQYRRPRAAHGQPCRRAEYTAAAADCALPAGNDYAVSGRAGHAAGGLHTEKRSAGHIDDCGVAERLAVCLSDHQSQRHQRRQQHPHLQPANGAARQRDRPAANPGGALDACVVAGRDEAGICAAVPGTGSDGICDLRPRHARRESRVPARPIGQREFTAAAGHLGDAGRNRLQHQRDRSSAPRVSEYILYPQAFIAQDKPDEAVPGLLDSVYDSIQEIIRADGAYSYVVSTYGQPDKIVDLATNQTSEMPGTLVKVSALAPSDVFVQVMPMTTYNNEWVITSPAFSAALGIAAPSPESLAIAPDGKQFAFITYENYPYGGKVYIVNDLGQFGAALGVKPQAEGVIHIPEFDAHYGEPGALSVYWGPSMMKLNE